MEDDVRVRDEDERGLDDGVGVCAQGASGPSTPYVVAEVVFASDANQPYPSSSLLDRERLLPQHA